MHCYTTLIEGTTRKEPEKSRFKIVNLELPPLKVFTDCTTKTYWHLGDISQNMTCVWKELPPEGSLEHRLEQSSIEMLPGEPTILEIPRVLLLPDGRIFMNKNGKEKYYRRNISWMITIARYILLKGEQSKEYEEHIKPYLTVKSSPSSP